MVLRTFYVRKLPVRRSWNSVQLSNQLPSNLNGSYAERPSNDRRTIVDVPDFDRSLEAIDALGALSLASVAPSVLPEDAPLTLPPLAIEELPLTAETISPR